MAGLAMAGGLPGLSWASRGNQLHIREGTDIISLDPAFLLHAGESTIGETLFQTLVRFKPNGTWDTEPDAAEYFEQVSGTRYDFRLKPGQQFTNGFGEMTADDVKFSFERIIDPELNAPNNVDMGPLSHVEVHDRYSGTLVLESPSTAFLPVGVAGYSGSIMSRKGMASVGGRFNTQPPFSSGPYQFKSWRANSRTIVERNPLWQGPKAAFEEIHQVIIPEPKAAEMAFEAGQLDSTLISVESAGLFERNMPPNSFLEVHNSGLNTWLGMNQSNPALQDLRVRQAIQYAIDVEAVVEAAWFGLVTPSMGPIPNGMLGHRERTLIPLRGDVNRARDLLVEAGVALPLRLSLDVEPDSDAKVAAQVIQWSLGKVGIEVEIRLHDKATMSTLGNESYGEQWRDIQLVYNSFVGQADPYYQLVWFTSQQLGEWNWERFSNEEFDRLNDEAVAISDPELRAPMYWRMQDIMEESGCYRFLTNGVMPHIIRKTVEPVFTPDGYPMLRDYRPARRQA